MKLYTLIAALCLRLSASIAPAGEPGLVLTYQPLDGQGSGEVEIHPVTAHDMFGHSGFPNEIPLITARNVPPNNSTHEIDDHNVANRAGIKISLEEDPSGKMVIHLDLTSLAVAERQV